MPEKNPIPGAIISIQTFGDFLGFNPHCHVLVTDGSASREMKKLEPIFRHKVFKMLLFRGRITKEYRKNWAWLIQEIYEVDPLTCST